jgi:hypothetical protein
VGDRVRITGARTVPMSGAAAPDDWHAVLVQAMVVDLAIKRYGPELEREAERMLQGLTTEEYRVIIHTKAKYPKVSLVDIYKTVMERAKPSSLPRRMAGWLFRKRGHSVTPHA